MDDEAQVLHAPWAGTGLSFTTLLLVHPRDNHLQPNPQDAVMQQFFGLVNTLLAGTPDAAARRLGMGTYRVVPISPAAGVCLCP
jgi:hypothetical protein